MEKASWKLTKSIMILVMVVLLLCSLLLGYVLSSLSDTLIDSSYLATEIIDQSINSRLKELRKYSLNIELSPQNSQIKRLDTLPENVSSVFYELAIQIQGYKYLNPIIEGVFVYYPKIDWIVGNLGTYPAASYYVLDNGLQAEGFSQLIERIQSGDNELFLFQKDGENHLYYRKKMLYRDQEVGYLLIRLNVEQLLFFSQERIDASVQDFAFALNLQGTTFAASGNRAVLDEEPVRVVKEEGAHFLDKSLLVQTRATTLEGLSYQLILPLAEQLRPVSIALRICITVMILIMLFSLVVAVVLGRRNARPLLELLQQVGASDGNQNDDAYVLLSKRIDELLKDKDDKIRALQYQKDAMGPLFLQNLLGGSISTEQEADALSRRYNIRLEYPFYVIGVVVSSTPVTQEVFQNVLTWIRSTQCDVLASRKDGNLVLLYSNDEYLNYENVVAVLDPLLAILPHPEQSLATLGTWQECLCEAVQSYHEAVILQDTAIAGRWTYQRDNNECSSSLLVHAKDAILHKQMQSAVSLLEELQARYTPETVKTAFAHHQLQEIEALLQHFLQQQGGNLCEKKDTSDDLIQRCMDLLQSIVFRQEREKAGDVLTVAERAVSIIERDFTDPLLGLYRIAEELHLSNSYLSTTFKAQYGVGIVQFINQKRIDFAKELIVNTEMSIKEIALACGFSSDISFIRVFKRHEDQTPGTLRKV